MIRVHLCMVTRASTRDGRRQRFRFGGARNPTAWNQGLHTKHRAGRLGGSAPNRKRLWNQSSQAGGTNILRCARQLVAEWKTEVVDAALQGGFESAGRAMKNAEHRVVAAQHVGGQGRNALARPWPEPPTNDARSFLRTPIRRVATPLSGRPATDFQTPRR